MLKEVFLSYIVLFLQVINNDKVTKITFSIVEWKIMLRSLSLISIIASFILRTQCLKDLNLQILGHIFFEQWEHYP